MNNLTPQNFETHFAKTLLHESGLAPEQVTNKQAYHALATLMREEMSQKSRAFRAKAFGSGAKQVHYLCMEFLMGRSLKNSLCNLGLDVAASAALAKSGLNIEEIYGEEPDAGLGNGGLGRLAACYLDGAASENIPLTGYSILYEYGIFRQKIVNGWQEEAPDNWLPGGGVWLKAHPEQSVEVRFGGSVQEHWDGSYHHVQHTGYDTVIAVPYNMYVAGYESTGISKLRLWQAKGPGFDMGSFNKGDFTAAVLQQSSAELISKVLYPNDNHQEGKILRLKQQYFLACATVTDILNEHLRQYGSPDSLPAKVAIQLNDTHPTLAILELLRLLLDECGYSWAAALDICRRVFSYTNHTVMSEALEKWDEDIFKATLPRVYTIAKELDKTARDAFLAAFPGDYGKAEYMAPISGGKVHMANICAYICHRINGVSALHSEIIKERVFNDFYLYSPKKFLNVTNGIAYRRWLLQANPGLSALIENAIGPAFKKDASALKQLAAFAHDSAFLADLLKVKQVNKARFTAQIERQTGQKLNTDALFDVQVKRLHEYKRQQLNAFHILSECLYILENPTAPFAPKTYIFGAKAAPGYYMAKQIIRFIFAVKNFIAAEPLLREKLQVVFLENYSVTMSELLMPASEISEQISLAGTEASGTGNMKFMVNGAVTLGTYDGANIEIAAAAGEDNFIRFGLSAEEVAAITAAGYRPGPYIEADPAAKATLAFLKAGFAGETFDELAADFVVTDHYMAMADFESYAAARLKAAGIYQKKPVFAKMCLANIAGAGVFSADRAVQDYARDIWHVKPVK